MADEEAQIPQGVLIEQGDSVVVDLQGIAEAKFEALPKGIYTFAIESCEFKKSSAGAWMFEFWNAVSDEGDYKGRKLPMYLSFSAKALPFTKRTIGLLGFPELMAQFDGQQIAASGVLLGRTFRARVDQSEYQGEMRSNIRTVVPANTPTTTGNGAAASKFA